MLNANVKARCNVFGVLKNIEYLAEHDRVSKELLKDTDIAVQFSVAGGPQANLAFRQGKAVLTAGRGRAALKLGFTSPEHFNRMIDGKGMPIPLKGFTKLSFLTSTFTSLAGRLTYYLKPDAEHLKDADFLRMNTEMTAYAAMFSLAEIANYDPKGQINARKIPDGIIQIGIKDSVGIMLSVKDGRIGAEKGFCPSPRAVLSFSSIKTAYDVFNGNIDTFSALALGDMEMRGYIPMVEYMNPVLDMVADYIG